MNCFPYVLQINLIIEKKRFLFPAGVPSVQNSKMIGEFSSFSTRCKCPTLVLLLLPTMNMKTSTRDFLSYMLFDNNINNG